MGSSPRTPGGAVDRLPYQEIRPRRLPDGYAYRGRADGPMAGGFVRAERQTALVHTRDRSPAEHHTPLTVFATDNPRQALAGTEGARGVRVDLGVPGVEAIYHDGIWHVDADVADEHGVDKGFAWLTGTCHSLTVRTATRVYGVRAPRDVPLAELVAIAASLPLR